MKTGKEVLDRALRLLGYTDQRGELDEAHDAALFKRGEAAVLQIYDDLKRVDRYSNSDGTLNDLLESVPLSVAAINDVMPYGVAMLIAQNEGDGDNQALFSVLYSRKRASVPRAVQTREDRLPRGGC